jgi:nucleoside-diphosphate-sugar epimerase
MVRVVSQVRPTVVFHLASLFLSAHKTAEVEPLVRSNVLFGTQLLEAMSIAGVDKLINTGTAWQHFENKSYNPVNLYAATKQAFEAIVDYYVEAGFITATTLELFDTYGPHDERGKLLEILRRGSKVDSLIQMSPGEQLIDLVHVDDVVAAFLTAADKMIHETRHIHARYAVSSGHPISVRELVSLIERVQGHPLPVAWGARPYRLREVMVPASLVPVVPGWSPGILLIDGLKQEFPRWRMAP